MASKSCFAAVLKGKNIVDHIIQKRESAPRREKELSATAAVVPHLCVGKVSIQCALCVLQLIFLHLRRASIRRKWNLSSGGVARPVADSRAWKFCTLANDFSNFSRPVGHRAAIRPQKFFPLESALKPKFIRLKMFVKRV